MLKRMLCLAIACLLTSPIWAKPSSARTQSEKDTKLAQKIKTKVAKLAGGPEARVEVKLMDGTRLKGCISEFSDDYFVVTDKKTGRATTVAYTQVKQLKVPVDNFWSDPKGWLGLGLGAGVILLSVWVKDKK